MSDQTKAEDLSHRELLARIDQMYADTKYNSVRAFWHPVLIGASLLGAGAAIGGLVVRAFS